MRLWYEALTLAASTGNWETALTLMQASIAGVLAMDGESVRAVQTPKATASPKAKAPKADAPKASPNKTKVPEGIDLAELCERMETRPPLRMRSA